MEAKIIDTKIQFQMLKKPTKYKHTLEKIILLEKKGALRA